MTSCRRSHKTNRAKLLSAALGALWFGVMPALLAALVVAFLVPAPASGARGVLGFIARVGGSYPVPFGVGVFLLFAAIAQYWRDRLPGSHLLRGPVEAAVFGNPGARVPNRARLRETRGVLLSVGLATALALGLRASVLGSYAVLTGSMLPTLEPGDVVGANKLAAVARRAGGSQQDQAHLPRRGDVVVFRSESVPLPARPSNPEYLVKRVVGLPGDRIGMRGGSPVVNGWLAPSCDAGEYLYVLAGGDGRAVQGRLRVEFLEDKAYLTLVAAEQQAFEGYDVKPGELFVLGDNRNNSLDSRSWNAGSGAGVPVLAVEARVQWFLRGTHRDGSADFTRFFHRVDPLRVHVERVDTRALDEGIARCLRERPNETYPPAPRASAAISALRPRTE